MSIGGLPMRLFIGIPFSERVRNQIRKAVMKIQPSIAKGKLSDWEGYHLTLKFLGEVSEQDMAKLALLMREASLPLTPFELRLTELGTFRKSGGDVLWLGVTVPPELVVLQQEVESLASLAGFEPEVRSYSPHLTLGRGVRYTESFEALSKHWTMKRLKVKVDRVVLFHSTKLSGRLAYVPLLIRRLGETRDAAAVDERMDNHEKE